MSTIDDTEIPSQILHFWKRPWDKFLLSFFCHLSIFDIWDHISMRVLTCMYVPTGHPGHETSIPSRYHVLYAWCHF